MSCSLCPNLPITVEIHARRVDHPALCAGLAGPEEVPPPQVCLCPYTFACVLGHLIWQSSLFHLFAHRASLQAFVVKLQYQVQRKAAIRIQSVVCICDAR